MKSIEQEKSWYDCVIRVLKEKREAMHYADIVDAIVKRKLRRNVGATPNQTVSVVLNTSIKKEDVKSPFVRIERGVYALSGKEASTVAEKEKVEEEALARTPSETAAEEEVAPIGAFGMYWRREMVKLVRHTRSIDGTAVRYFRSRGFRKPGRSVFATRS
jgi:HB1, ASXL, restriction endonuclease HTH domain